MFGGDKGKTRRVHNLQTDVAALEAALEAAKAEYDRVLDRNLKVHCACQIDISSQGCVSALQPPREPSCGCHALYSCQRLARMSADVCYCLLGEGRAHDIGMLMRYLIYIL